MKMEVNAELKQLGFTEQNILRIARFTKYIDIVELQLLGKVTLIKEMVKLGFTTSNFASILAHTGLNCDEAMENLHENIDILKQCMEEIGFSAANMSSILSSTGIHVGDVIEDIYSEKATLLGLMNKFRIN
ncbi:MAG: hypothetical protein AB8B67_04685 [Rickettsiaceae bacterium]